MIVNKFSEILNNSVLLVVDMQDAILDLLPDREEVVRRASFAIEAAQLLGMELIYTEQVPEKLGRTNEELMSLSSEGAKVFGKNTFSALGDDRVCGYLEGKGCENIVIVGVETPICVYQTVFSGLVKGYDVELLTDCIGARRQKDGERVIDLLMDEGVECLPSEAYFYRNLVSSEHPRFRGFTELVKKYTV